MPPDRIRGGEALTLTILLEDQLALLPFVFVLSTSPVLATLYHTDHRYPIE